jgi:hypothetical protein
MRLFLVVAILGMLMLYTTIMPIAWGTFALRELIWTGNNLWGWLAASYNCLDCVKDMRANPMPKDGDHDDVEQKRGDYRLARLGLIMHSVFAIASFGFMCWGLYLLKSEEPVRPRIIEFTNIIVPFVLIAISVSMTWASNFVKAERPQIMRHYRRAREQALAYMGEAWNGVERRRREK